VNIGLCAWSFTGAHKEAGRAIDPHTPEGLTRLARDNGLHSVEFASQWLGDCSPEERAVFAETRADLDLSLEYALSPRTLLQAGVQGFGPLPYRMRDDTSDRRSFERSTLSLTLTNSTHYFGYDLRAIVGVARDELQYDGGFRDHRKVNVLEFFVRAGWLHRVRAAHLDP